MLHAISAERNSEGTVGFIVNDLRSLVDNEFLADVADEIISVICSSATSATKSAANTL
ncbi:MAG: hypothetical protein KME43_03455 [Myxacorys chilensis ATA2-1-KO14]|jgi:hypothetical protein|nr:hypothetical protein [Myxacorys chilensis ATA2-1-KO14]